MKRVLIVDDEPNFLRAVTDGLAMYSSLDVVTAANGRDALAKLREEPATDLLITDLNMPVMDGFELLANASRLPRRTPTIVITAFGSADAKARLEQLGEIALLEKPLDIEELTERIFAALTPGDRGFLPGMVSLPTFLQLLQMERKTCHLTVAAGPRAGEMCLADGQVVYARTGALSGDRAAFEIIGWPEARISIDSLCRTTEHNVKAGLSYLIMESLRLKDEQGAGLAPDLDLDAAFAPTADDAPVATPAPAARRAPASPAPAPASPAPARPPAAAAAPVPAPPSPSAPHATVRLPRVPPPGAAAAHPPPHTTAPAPAVVPPRPPLTAQIPAVPPPPNPRPSKEQTMSIEAHLKSLRDIRGYRASAVMNFTGEVLVTDSVDPGIDLALVGATFNDIFRSAHEASSKIGLDATRETVIKTPKGLVVMACSGPEAKIHFHFIAVLGEDGNQALLKMRVDSMMPKLLTELA